MIKFLLRGINQSKGSQALFQLFKELRELTRFLIQIIIFFNFSNLDKCQIFHIYYFFCFGLSDSSFHCFL